MDFDQISDTLKDTGLVAEGTEPQKESLCFPADNSVFANLAGYEPTPIEEKDFGPRILQGKYNGVITKFERRFGEWPSGDTYDEYTCHVQVTDTVDAKVDGDNMYVNKSYNLQDTAYRTGAQSLEGMLNQLNQFVEPIQVSGNNADEIFADLDMKLALLVGKTVTIRIWPQKYKADWQDKKKGELKTDRNGYVRHGFTFVNRVDLNSDVIDLG